MEMGSLSGASGTHHKRSHSFNNHHSYSQYVQQQPPHKGQQNDISSWLQSSSDALSSQASSVGNSSRLTSATTSHKITAFEFAEKLEKSSNFQGRQCAKYISLYLCGLGSCKVTQMMKPQVVLYQY